jgi:RNA polymerase sigma factor (sigma-70 family)
MASRPPPAVFIVDHDDESRSHVGRWLKAVDVHHQAFSAPADFLARLREDSRGILLLDCDGPDVHGLELLNQLRHRETRLPVIMMSARADVPTAMQAVKRGVIDFLEKPLDKRVLLATVQAGLAQEAEHFQAARRRRRLSQRFAELTPRENQVLEHLIVGRANKEIAREFGVSTQAIDAHRKRILRKIGINTVTELAWLASLLGRPLPESIRRFADGDGLHDQPAR